jgi:hypothetical protein
MTKMDMIWIATAMLLHPHLGASRTVPRYSIEKRIGTLFSESITPVMLNKHLVSFEDRQADKNDSRRGGSRNRYLFRTENGSSPSRSGEFRLYKSIDSRHDGQDKIGPTHPDRSVIDIDYHYLLDWHESEYFTKSE